jgi:membrane protease YdiL (CAAX protease family)
MSFASHEDKAEVTRNISPLWIILYLPLHQFVAQTFCYENCFLYLRVAFLTLLIVVLLIKRETVQLRDIFFGRWLHDRNDWIMAFVFISLVLVFRIILALSFQFTMEPLTPMAYIMIAIVPAINEEIVFRGLFLSALLACIPRRPWAAIGISTVIFVSCHYLIGSHIDTWIALSIQSLIYGACYLKTRCLPLCMLCHWLWNSLLWFTGPINPIWSFYHTQITWPVS